MPVRRSRRLQNNDNDDNNNNAVDANPVIPPLPGNPPNANPANVVAHVQAEDEQKDVPKVPSNQIPANIEDGYVGWDTTHNFIIQSDGAILLDHRRGNNETLSATHRNNKYNQHKKYVVKQTVSMMEQSRSITMVCTTNAERIGQPRAVTTLLLSPSFYEPKHRDLLVM
eukprot:77430_1